MQQGKRCGLSFAIGAHRVASADKRHLGNVIDEHVLDQPVGLPSRGKKQLRFEEAERFITYGLRLFDEKGDAMALAAVTALLLGCRASAVLRMQWRRPWGMARS